jgi:hypothetical protein
MPGFDDRDVRVALAGRAYRSRTVRLATRDLAGCSHIVGTRHGLFATDGGSVRLIAYGMFFGITVRDELIFAFEACDRPRSRTPRGRIVRFRRDGMTIVAADVIAEGLDTGCHQIDIIDGRLCVIDTYNQRVLRLALAGGEPETLFPLPPARFDDWVGGYVHLNALIAHGDEILLMLHNGAGKTGRPSEVARLSRDWRLIARTTLDGLGCHNFAILENGSVLMCGSMAGELISTDGLKIGVTEMLTRGLSVDDAGIVVGGSRIVDRASRDAAEGALFFLDRNYGPVRSVPIPSLPMEIRRIDGRDRSLSDHLARIGAGPVHAATA